MDSEGKILWSATVLVPTLMKNEKNYVDVVVLVRNVWIKIRKITGHPMALKKENINNNLEVVLEAVEVIGVVAKILIRIATVRNQSKTIMRIMIVKKIKDIPETDKKIKDLPEMDKKIKDIPDMTVKKSKLHPHHPLAIGLMSSQMPPT
jgi:hypothetical protein